MYTNRFSSRSGLRSPWVVLASCVLGGALGAQRPALVVVVSVDQLARWVFEEALPQFSTDNAGFRRLLDHGVYFDRCAHRHGCTETGPGHATIGTGAPAAVHGIVGNTWIDQGTGRAVYCATSPDALAVGGGAGGRGPGTLLVPTLGDAMKEQIEGCRVVSVSLKDRSAILMGGRRADIALWLDQSSGRFVSSTAYVTTLPAWLDRFGGAYPLDRFFGRTWAWIGPPSAYQGLVDDRPFEVPDANGSRTLPQVIDGGLAAPGPAFYMSVYTSPFGNEALVDLARAAIGAYGLGADAVPDLLCVGFSSTDAIGHRNGPQSVEVRDTLLRLDQQLEDLMRTLDARVGQGRYSLFLSADHGVGPAPETRTAAGLPGGRATRTTLLASNVVSKALRDAYGAPPEGEKSWVYGLSGSWLYLNRPALDAKGIAREEAAAKAAQALAGLEGVAHAIPTVGEPGVEGELATILRDTAQPDRAGDVWVVLQPYWLSTPTPAASHGSPWEYDRDVPLLAYGAGLRQGQRLSGAVSPGAIAVLAAALCGIEPPSGAREPLPREALR